jgi:hypothetical protein
VLILAGGPVAVSSALASTMARIAAQVIEPVSGELGELHFEGVARPRA